MYGGPYGQYGSAPVGSQQPAGAGKCSASGSYLQSPDSFAGSSFGASVSAGAKGGVIAVGQPSYDGGNGGTVYVFKDVGKCTFKGVPLDVPNDPNCIEFGSLIAMSRNNQFLVVSCGIQAEQPVNTVPPVYLYIKQRDGSYKNSGLLPVKPPRDGCGLTYDNGMSLAMSKDGKKMMVAWSCGNEKGKGSVQVFARGTSGWTVYSLVPPSTGKCMVQCGVCSMQVT